MIKITKKSFLEKLEGKNVALMTARFVKLSLNECLEIVENHIENIYSDKGINVGKFEKTSAGYKRYIANKNAYSYAELNKYIVYTDTNKLYVLFKKCNDVNSIMVLREAA